MPMYIKCLFLVVSILIEFNYGFTDFINKGINVDSKLIVKVIEKISDLERKVTKMETNEKQMMESIRALIQTNAQFRLANMELQKRLKNVETDAQEHVNRELENRVKNLEAELKEKGPVFNNLEKIWEYKKDGDNSFCVKSGILPCSDGKEETFGAPEKAERDKRLVLTEPARPAFTAYLDYPVKTLGKDQAIAYNRVLLNDGKAYSNSSGIFTASISGVYLFTWSVTARKLAGENAYDVWVKLVINGNHAVGAVAESRDNGDDNQGSSTAILHVNQGDQVWTAHQNGYPYTRIHGDDIERTTSFSGVLLYED